MLKTEGQLIFTPKADDEGELYEITGLATLPGLMEAKTLPKLASPSGTEERCSAKLLGIASLAA